MTDLMSHDLEGDLEEMEEGLITSILCVAGDIGNLIAEIKADGGVGISIINKDTETIQGISFVAGFQPSEMRKFFAAGIQLIDTLQSKDRKIKGLPLPQESK